MIVRDAVWIGVGQAIVVCAGLASTRILTTLLPPEVYGQISLVVGLGTLSTGLFCLPFLQAALRSFPDAQLAGQIGALRRLARVYVQRGVLVAGLLLALGGLAGCSGQSGLSPREFFWWRRDWWVRMPGGLSSPACSTEHGDNGITLCASGWTPWHGHSPPSCSSGGWDRPLCLCCWVLCWALPPSPCCSGKASWQTPPRQSPPP